MEIKLYIDGNGKAVGDDIAMHFIKTEKAFESVQLGLCPEPAYEEMIVINYTSR